MAIVLNVWSSTNVLASIRLEEKRKAFSAAYHKQKKVIRRQLTEAKKNANVDDKSRALLAQYGYQV